MATVAQITANKANSQHSTGPQTPEGKARVSQNATTGGLYAKENLIFPGEEPHFAELRSGLLIELEPQGVLQDIQFKLILNAAWRLLRTGHTEGKFGERSSNSDVVDNVMKPIDRARAVAQRQYRQAMAELRRLQTEHAFRLFAHGKGLPYATGAADSRALHAMINATRHQNPSNPAPKPPTPAAKPIHIVASAAAATPAPVNRL